MTGKFYQIEIGGIVLSSTGESGGIPCKLTVEGIERLLRNATGVSTQVIGGGRVNQIALWTAGKPFAVRVEVIGKNQWEDLKELLDESCETGATFTVEGFGTPGNFEVTAEADPENPYSWESFTATRIENLVLRFFTK